MLRFDEIHLKHLTNALTGAIINTSKGQGTDPQGQKGVHHEAVHHHLRLPAVLRTGLRPPYRAGARGQGGSAGAEKHPRREESRPDGLGHLQVTLTETLTL